MKNLISELWEKRSLILLLSFNEVKLRYKNSLLGFLWSFLEPLLLLGVLYFIFVNIFQNSIPNYPLYLLLGLIIWYTFSRGTSMGLSSLIDRSGILKTIYFRREIVVLSTTLTSAIMFCFEFASFLVFLVIFQFAPPVTMLLLPLLIIDLLFLILGVSMILSVLYVYFRDIKFIWQVALQAGFFASPIFYTIDMLPEPLRNLMLLNPMSPILITAQNIVLYGTLPTVNTLIFLLVFPISILLVGLKLFDMKSKRIVEKF